MRNVRAESKRDAVQQSVQAWLLQILQRECLIINDVPSNVLLCPGRVATFSVGNQFSGTSNLPVTLNIRYAVRRLPFVLI